MSQDDADKTTGEQRGRPFPKGQSGNPAGRPQGSRNKATLALEALMDGQAETITQKAIELALQGDTTALRLCLERICPPRKSRPVNITLPEVKTVDGVAEAQAAVVQAVADGELTPEEGTAITNILEARRKAIETQDHEGRIAKLENEGRNNANNR
jgi:Family of unknown function (DUF5681)